MSSLFTRNTLLNKEHHTAVKDKAKISANISSDITVAIKMNPEIVYLNSLNGVKFKNQIRQKKVEEIFNTNAEL